MDDINIWRAAHQLIKMHGKRAAWEAAMRLESKAMSLMPTFGTALQWQSTNFNALIAQQTSP